MSDQEALLCAYLLDGRGGGRKLDWTAVNEWTPDTGPLWVHLDRKHEAAREWLYRHCGSNSLLCEALLAEETRPRCEHTPQGALVILRGVNFNPGADPDDMISIRLWMEPHLIISLRHSKTLAIADIADCLARGKGPINPGGLLVAVAVRLTSRIGPVVDQLDDAIDGLEQGVIDTPAHHLRSRIADLRRQTITLRRYLAPQRNVLARLQMERVPWLEDPDRLHLREVSDQLLRHVEDLDAARERTTVAHEELTGVLGERMNRNMYILSMMAAVFLPLGLLTGLLGINVGGIPGAANDAAFYIVCVTLVLVAVFQVWLFRRLHLL